VVRRLSYLTDYLRVCGCLSLLLSEYLPVVSRSVCLNGVEERGVPLPSLLPVPSTRGFPLPSLNSVFPLLPPSFRTSSRCHHIIPHHTPTTPHTPTTHTPTMDLLSESLKGRLLFAIPKKGASGANSFHTFFTSTDSTQYRQALREMPRAAGGCVSSQPSSLPLPASTPADA